MLKNTRIEFWVSFMTTIRKNLHKYLKYNLKDINLRKEEVHFLHYICEYKGVEQKSLSKAFNVDKSTTTRKVKKLINYGYIKRKVDHNDHRKYLLFATAKGNDLSKYVIDLFNQWSDEITKDLKEEELHVFKKACEQIIQNSNDLIERTIINE